MAATTLSSNHNLCKHCDSLDEDIRTKLTLLFLDVEDEQHLTLGNIIVMVERELLKIGQQFRTEFTFTFDSVTGIFHFTCQECDCDCDEEIHVYTDTYTCAINAFKQLNG